MRRPTALLVLCAALAAAEPACAAPLRLSGDTRPNQDMYTEGRTAQPWSNDRSVPILSQKPIGELIAMRLGLADGSAELFQYRVENAPNNKTVLDGVIDGGGIKLKLTW